ncbi:MAG: hypothetical protein ACM3IL_05200, partial [Deltaproteobacteria bacterium]
RNLWSESDISCMAELIPKLTRTFRRKVRVFKQGTKGAFTGNSTCEVDAANSVDVLKFRIIPSYP